MASSDYYLCDECEQKTFYEARVSYDEDNHNPQTGHPWPDHVGWMRVLCHDCAARKPEAEDTQPERSEGQHVLPNELVEAVRFAAAVIDGCLVNDEDAMNSMEAARNGLRKALPLPLLLPTEEQVRAEHLQELIADFDRKAREARANTGSALNWNELRAIDRMEVAAEALRSIQKEGK